MVAAAATVVGGESLLLASRSLFRVKVAAWNSAGNYARSNLSLYVQGLSWELKMGRKGRKVDVDKKKQNSVTQVWRAVSTQPSFCEGDNDTVKLQSQLGDQAISTNVSTSTSENTNPEVLNEPVDPNTCPRPAHSNKDASSDGRTIQPEKHSLCMEIGSSLLMRFIRGKGGSTQEEIEQETQVKIIFPSSGKEDSIIIEGDSAESVAKASEKIQSIIDKAVNSRHFDYSHFVSLPLAIHPELVDKLVNFQNKILGIEASDKNQNPDSSTDGDTSAKKGQDQHQDPFNASKVSTEMEAENAGPLVNIINEEPSTEATPVAVELKAEDSTVKVDLTSIPLVSYAPKESAASVSEASSKEKDSGIEKSIFIKPKTFHLTVLMLKLWNKERVKKAEEVLKNVSSKVMDALENQPISIRLKGLECMKGSLAKARVVYAPVDEIGSQGRLMRACHVIIDAFVEAGLVLENDSQQKLKLHATIMNARHRKRKYRTREADSFDARDIFKQYGSEEWGEYMLREAHLSQRFVFDENGYYHCCASIPFPDSMQVD